MANITASLVNELRKRTGVGMMAAITAADYGKNVLLLEKRERLLLQLSTILHDCGKYISMVNLGECSYSIIMATEIIGLSHLEREIVANVVKYNHLEFDYYEAMNSNTMKEEKLLITVDTQEDITLEKGLFDARADFFEEVYNIRPVIRRKWSS